MYNVHRRQKKMKMEVVKMTLVMTKRHDRRKNDKIVGKRQFRKMAHKCKNDTALYKRQESQANDN